MMKGGRNRDRITADIILVRSFKQIESNTLSEIYRI